MDTARRCPQCNGLLAADAPEGLCPKCLLEGGAGGSDSQATLEPRAAAGGAPALCDVARALTAIEDGDRQAADHLLNVVYEELRRLAGRLLRREQPGQTLQATALVHEAYLRLVGSGDPGWQGRRHFFASAAEAMRRILVENARRKKSLKRGGGRRREELEGLAIAAPGPAVDLLALDDALRELQHHDPQAAELVKLRYFAGLKHQEAAEVLGIGRRAADRLWAVARAWLYQKLSK